MAGAAFLAAATSASATDLGVQARVWQITEQDIRELIAAQMAEVDWSEKEDELKTSAKNYTKNLPQRSLPEAEKTETKYIDMSIQLSSDIKIPVKGADGKYTWQVYYKKGMMMNPLSKVRPVEALLYFDGRSPEQTAFAKEVTADPFSNIIPIEASGEAYDRTLKEFDRIVFYGYEPQIQRFNITKLPALIYAGEGKYSQYMANTVFAKPYKAATLSAVWPQFKVKSSK